MNKIKQYIIIGIGILILFSGLYFVFVSYLVTGGFRDYKAYCSRYIPLIDAYHAQNRRYPADLSSLGPMEASTSHDPAQCRYSATENGYTITVPAGLAGRLIYSSETGKWRVE